MTRLFRRGELQRAILVALGGIGRGNGYIVMQTLAERVGGTWQPSPGAVYPALLGLEDAGLVEGRDQDGTRVYELTASGLRALATHTGVLDDVAARARATAEQGPTVGELLDRFAAERLGRAHRLGPAGAEATQGALDRCGAAIDRILDKERA